MGVGAPAIHIQSSHTHGSNQLQTVVLRTMLIEENPVCKWARAAQTHVLQESTVDLSELHD